MPAADPTDLSADADLLVAACREGGEIALSYFRRDPRAWNKDGGSPVSEADLAVDRHLRTLLTAARPDYGWLSEETADDPDRLGRTRVFVVDPIDGTRAFLRGDIEWTVSLAVVEAGRPIAAALLQPVTGTLWRATVGGGAVRDGAPIAVAGGTDFDAARISGPRMYLDRPQMREFAFSERRFVPSLALRIALVADGRLDVAYGSGNANDWDLAAADLLVQEAGGRFTVPSGEPPRYNRAVPRHPPLVAASAGLYDAARALLVRLD